MKNKILSLIMAFTVFVSCISLGFTAYAKTVEITILDSVYSAETSGAGDLVVFTFTPTTTGTYSFMSMNVKSSKGYLFVKTVDEDGSEWYTQLGYSSQNPNYAEDGQKNIEQFCLTHYLIAGTKYYFAAGWSSQSLASAMMNVKLRCDSYDDDVLKDIEVSCSAKLSWYTDGSWQTDANKELYYLYNYSKIIQNMTVTLIYYDGTRVSKTGVTDTIDGYSIRYSHSQEVNHWYVQRDEKYTSNILKVSVLDKSVDYNVVIDETPLYAAKGRIVNYADGTPVKNATISIGASRLATTDENGKFAFVHNTGSFSATIDAENAIKRVVTINIGALPNGNDYTQTPIGIAIGDYVKDGIINVKDFAYVIQYMDDADKEIAKANFPKQMNLRTSRYPSLTLTPKSE